jgi:hypothetical protein
MGAAAPALRHSGGLLLPPLLCSLPLSLFPSLCGTALASLTPTFSGLMSRSMTFMPWHCATARTISRTSRRASCSE